MSIPKTPLVSVLTPVYNNGEFIAECIESILGQTYTNFEYLIVNNCSTDKTLEIAQLYAKKDSRIRVHNNEEFLGVIENHNLAFSLMPSEAKYCKVVSADDFIHPDCLRSMVELAEANPSIGMVGSYSIAGKKVMWDGLEYEKTVVNGHELCRATLLGGPYVFGSPTSLMYRADLLRTGKAFYPNSMPHADTSACYEALEHTDFGFVHQVLSYSRIHSASQTSKSFKLGIINRASIADMARYGPLYLSRQEQQGRLKVLLDKYYGWLVGALFEHSMKRKFWDLQKTGLRDIGFDLSVSRLLKAFLIRGLELVTQPSITIKKILAVSAKRGKVEARYYY